MLPDLEDELEEEAPRAASGRRQSEEGDSPRRNRYDDVGELSDEMDDFIVDREGGDRRRARRRRDARMAEAAGLSTAAVQVGAGASCCTAQTAVWDMSKGVVGQKRRCMRMHTGLAAFAL